MGYSTFATRVDNRYFEDYTAGSQFEFGPVEVHEAEIIEFASRFDPQVFHTDPEAAKKTVFGGLIASGWHTASLMMRLCVDHYLSSVASLGSPGVDELRWIRPVRPGDKLTARITVIDANRSRSKSDIGVVRSFIEMVNQDGEVVMSMKAVNFLACRNLPR